MNQHTNQTRLIKVIDTLRDYGHRIIEGLSQEELNWIPSETKGRSITSIFRHIVEGEIYWLDFIGHKPPQTVDQLPSLSFRN